MSITYRAYVGPYVRCAVTMVDTPQTRNACLNPSCTMHDRYSSAPFCHLCGSKNGEIAYIEQKPSVDQWDIQERPLWRLAGLSGDGYDTWMRESLAQIWIPNHRTLWRDGHLENRVDFSLEPITAEQVTTEQSAFQDFFAAEMAVLIVQYGADNVTVEWGVIQDYN